LGIQGELLLALPPGDPGVKLTVLGQRIPSLDLLVAKPHQPLDFIVLMAHSTPHSCLVNGPFLIPV